MSYDGDAKKLRKALAKQGWRVEDRTKHWLLFPPMPDDADRTDPRYHPVRMASTPSSQRTWLNLLADLKRKGYNP